MITLDFETRSEVDLVKTGAWVYSQHPSTDILCLAFKYDDGEVALKTTDQLGDLNCALRVKIQQGEIVESHNAFFEKVIWQNIMVKRYGWPEIPESQWRCSASVAAYHALPRSLQTAGAALRLETVKDTDGKKVMMQLSKPKPRVGGFISKEEHPDKYETLYKYCKADVDAEYAVSQRLGQLPERELKIWQLDQKINLRGVHIDTKAVDASLKILAEFIEKLEAEAVAIAKGAFETVNQRAKVMEWCQAQGEAVTAYDKAYLAETMSSIKSPKVKRILEIRQALGKTSTAKYEAMKNSTAKDGRIRDTLKYHGALTGRWSGRLVQFQNLPRGNLKDMDLAVRLIKQGSVKRIEMLHGNFMNFMSAAIRGMVCAPEGKLLVVSDFAAIEARVLGWLAGSGNMLTQFRNGEDLYKDMASKIYHVPVSEVTSDQRQLGKAAILGAGYGMGPTKFYQTCLSWGIKVDEDLAASAINTYRTTYNHVPKCWHDQERAAHAAVRTRKKIICGHTAWFVEDGFLKCQLPSGRCLNYYDPKFEKKRSDWGEGFELTYLGEKNGGCYRIGTYGGKLVENIVQAIARDLMAEAMLRVEAAGFEVVLSVHDELVAEVKVDSIHGALTPIGIEKKLKEFNSLMAETPDWAFGCPVEASGWIGKRYRK
jgi:DNA polymerase bacteriophage-type